MIRGFSDGDRVVNTRRVSDIYPVKIGDTGTFKGYRAFDDGNTCLVEFDRDVGGHGGDRSVSGTTRHCLWMGDDQIELIDGEDTTMTKKSNPKNFRNGDIIKVSGNKVSVHSSDALVFVKFGENYYNLTAGGQMKACRYLPLGTKEIITNLSGMGKFFLMSEEELEEQAGRPSGGSTTGTNPVTDFEHIMKIADSYNYTDTTEEK